MVCGIPVPHLRIPHPLLCSTCSTQRYGSMPWSIVLYLTTPHHQGMLYIHTHRGHTGTPNRTYQQVLVLCTMSILVIPQCSVVQYTLLSIPVHRMLTVLQVPQLGTLDITAPHNRTYPEYSWLVYVLYAAMPLVYSAMPLCTVCYAMYYIPLLHHPSHVVCIHRGVEDTTHWNMAKEM